MKRSIVLLAFAGTVGIGVVAEATRPPACPSFLVNDGDDADFRPDGVQTTLVDGECLLHQDVVDLVRPLELKPGVRLNCQGHLILPLTPGQPDDPLNPVFNAVPSQPQLAVFLNDVQGIAVRNCRIGSPDGPGFDFGILAINSEGAATPTFLRNRIVDNEIHAAYVGINLIASDDFDIEGNDIVYSVQGGSAVHLQHGSQRNSVKSNYILGDLQAAGALGVPGPPDLDALGRPITCMQGQLCSNSNPVIGAMNGAVVVTQVLGFHPQLWNAVIGGALHQLTFESSAEVTDDFTADNTIEDNEISFNIASSLGPTSGESGVVAVASLRTVARDNRIERPSAIGIRDGLITEQRLFPGKCTLDLGRLCLADDDCFIPGVDSRSKGTCAAPPAQPVAAQWFARELRVEDNEIRGPFRGGISVAAESAEVRRNEIDGPIVQGGLAGILLRGKFGLETSIVTDNRVANVSTALRLDESFFGLSASFFDARISRNDFTGYTLAIQTTSNDNDYDLVSELSVVGSGNYWGLTCDQGGFDPSKVNGTANPVVTDSYPYGEPVAGTPEEDLPPTCF